MSNEIFAQYYKCLVTTKGSPVFNNSYIEDSEKRQKKISESTINKVTKVTERELNHPHRAQATNIQQMKMI